MNINHQILFDRYEVIKSLGTGSFSQVYLVRHLSLEQERALKILPKESGLSSSELLEAKLLRSFDHPAIPKIFDIEQDESNFYLVEEYINGESLSYFLLHQQFISQGLFFNFCEQLCDIFIYLHTFAPSPVIYRDLKPEHIIVCQNQLKLIDFGVSSYVSKTGNNFNHYGNVDFSAPECFTENTINETADIYSLGKLIEYLTGYMDTSFSHKFKQLIHKATSPDPAMRYETVAQLSQEIKKIKEGISQQRLSKKIAVIGSHRGCGTTHIAISISCSLNKMGYSSIYVDCVSGNLLQNSMDLTDKIAHKNGFFYFKSFCGTPLYRQGISVDFPENSILVYDYGTDFSNSDLSMMDQVLVVCSGNFWNIHNSINLITSLNNLISPVDYICNLCSKSNEIALAKILGHHIYHFPFDPDVFNHTNQKEKLVLTLLDKGGTLQSFFRKKSLLWIHRK